MVLGLLAASLVLGLGLWSRAQLTDEYIARRPFWEKFLREAKIIHAENVGEGVTHPKRLRLKKGEVEAFGLWKRPTAAGSGRFDKWEHEIAAYRLDRILGLNMVPPAVERSYHGYAGSLQLWVDLSYSELKLAKENIVPPAGIQDARDKARSLQRAFDSLIANSDRTLQNMRYTEDWRLVLIDHSQSFRDLPPYTGRLLYPVGDDPGTPGIGRLPRRFVAGMRALTHASIRAAVEDYLTSSEIDELLVRRDLLLRGIEALVTARAEDRVLY